MSVLLLSARLLVDDDVSFGVFPASHDHSPCALFPPSDLSPLILDPLLAASLEVHAATLLVEPFFHIPPVPSIPPPSSIRLSIKDSHGTGRKEAFV